MTNSTSNDVHRGWRRVAAGAMVAVALVLGWTIPIKFATAEEWWTRPWDYKVSPNPDEKNKWYLPCVNDLGGTPEKDNQRDISKSLGRIRKYREQTLFRLMEKRDMGEVALQGWGPMAEADVDARPFFEQAEKLIQQAIPLQRAGKTAEATPLVAEAKKQLNQGESIAELAIAVAGDRQHVQHLRNAALETSATELESEIASLEASIAKAAERRVADPKASLAEQQAEIDRQRKAIAAMSDRVAAKEFDAALDFYQYLLDIAAHRADRIANYGGEKIARDAVITDLDLGVIGSSSRRVEQLRFKLRQLSNRISASNKKPLSDSPSDKLSARTGYPIDDLDHFTRSKFGWVRANRLIDNDLWDWECNYTPTDADALSIAGRWEFQTDPKSEGESKGWFRADFDASGWRNIYAPNWWEREGVTDYNPLDNVAAAHKVATGSDYPPMGNLGRRQLDHRQYNGIAWYRKSVFVPKSWAGKNVLVRGGVLQDRFKIYVNGKPADDKWQSGGWGLRDLVIPAAALQFGAVNQLTICCYNTSGPGGLADGPLWLVREGGTAQFRHTPLGGAFVKEEIYGTTGGQKRITQIQSVMSPGVILISDSDALDLSGWSMKGYAVPSHAVFVGKGGVQSVSLDSAKQITTGADMAENWLLLDVPKGRGNPLLIVFQKKPKQIRWTADSLREGLHAEFSGGTGEVGLVHPGRNGDAHESLVEHSRFWSRAMLAYPEHASELWTVDPSKKNLAFEVMGTFHLVYNYHRIQDEWGTKPLEIAPLPILSSYALDYKYPGFPEGEWKKTGAPVRFQEYAQCEYRARSRRQSSHVHHALRDQATLWQGIGTFTNQEVSRTDNKGQPKAMWSVAQIKKWGSNNNRLALHLWSRLIGNKENWWDLGFQYSFDGDILPPDHENWKRFDKIIQDHVNNDMLLILDGFQDDQEMRPGDDAAPQGGHWMRKHPNSIPSHVKLWTYLAERYKNVSPRHFAYNFYNEPAYIDPETYNKAIQAITAGVRSVDKDKWITIDMGDGWAQPNWMFATKPTGDPKTVYQFHFYFKHDDSIINGRDPEWFYPQWSMGRPFMYMHSRESFMSNLIDTMVYQTVHHVPTWNGEFGGSINNPQQEMLLWIEDEVTHLDRMGQGWSWWNWDGHGFGRTGLQDGDLVSPGALVLRRFMYRKGAY